MPQQQAQAPRDQPSIAEMTRLMDVAAAIRKERLTAEQQLNISDTKKLLRERLLESARVSGDPVTEQEIDAAIDAYYERLHEFQPPEPGFETFLASLYVRRGVIAQTAIVAATLAALWWGVFAFGVVGKKRTERVVGAAYSQVEETAAAVEELAVVPEMKDRVAALLSDAAQARDASDAARLNAIHRQLAEHATILRQEYSVRIVGGEGERSAFEREYTDDSGKRSAGFYVIVQAEDPSGNAIPVPIYDAESGKTVTVTRWAEQVPEGVYNRLEADKKADGVLDARGFAEKERGRTELTIRMSTNNGAAVQRGRQITQW